MSRGPEHTTPGEIVGGSIVLMIVLFPLIRWVCLTYARLLAGLFLIIIHPIRTTRAAKQAVAAYIRGPHPVLRWLAGAVAVLVVWCLFWVGLVVIEVRLNLVPELHNNREGFVMAFGALATVATGVLIAGWRAWCRGTPTK